MINYIEKEHNVFLKQLELCEVQESCKSTFFQIVQKMLNKSLNLQGSKKPFSWG
jgi:hypothetical protein